MNSWNARRHTTTAAFTVAVFFITPLLFAQIHVRVKTPGSDFSEVSPKARVDNVASGRRFRPAEITTEWPGGQKVTGPVQFENLTIRGMLRTPASHPSGSTTHKIQRLAIHFRTDSGRNPSHLYTVSLYQGRTIYRIFTADLQGDYATREVADPKGKTALGANVWVFDPPITVYPQTTIVLEVGFGGGIDSVVDNGEFVLISVDADFPTTPIAGTSAISGKNVTPALDPSVKPIAAVPPTSIWPNGKAYLFKGPQYVRYDPKADKVDQGYPLPIAGNWPGFTPDFAAGVDASVVWNNKKVYFFKGTQYLRYDIAADKVDQGYPLPIAGHWPGLWEQDIDAAVVWPNGKAYFFKGSQYIRYDIATDKADAGYPVAIKDGWPGFPESFAQGVDRAVVWNNGKAYFFKGSEYIRYDIATDKTDGGPRPIAGNWPGLWK